MSEVSSPIGPVASWVTSPPANYNAGESFFVILKWQINDDDDDDEVCTTFLKINLQLLIQNFDQNRGHLINRKVSVIVGEWFFVWGNIVCTTLYTCCLLAGVFSRSNNLDKSFSSFSLKWKERQRFVIFFVKVIN